MKRRDSENFAWDVCPLTALQRTRRRRFRSGRSLRSLGSPVTRHPLGGSLLADQSLPEQAREEHRAETSRP